jgi:hypothetical protein
LRRRKLLLIGVSLGLAGSWLTFSFKSLLGRRHHYTEKPICSLPNDSTSDFESATDVSKIPLSELHYKIMSDFLNGRTVYVQGWMLSFTEVLYLRDLARQASPILFHGCTVYSSYMEKIDYLWRLSRKIKKYISKM